MISIRVISAGASKSDFNTPSIKATTLAAAPTIVACRHVPSDEVIRIGKTNTARGCWAALAISGYTSAVTATPAKPKHDRVPELAPPSPHERTLSTDVLPAGDGLDEFATEFEMASEGRGWARPTARGSSGVPPFRQVEVRHHGRRRRQRVPRTEEVVAELWVHGGPRSNRSSGSAERHLPRTSSNSTGEVFLDPLAGSDQGCAKSCRGLWLLRHGQSLGNVANDAARTSDVEELELAERDMDVPLSDLGRQQAAAFGRWLRSEARADRPDVVVSSPYVRAVETAEIVLDEARLDTTIIDDERLREREFGVVDLLTHRGVVARLPEEATRRERLGKFYYRAPGGESWVDVALRLRSLRDSLVREHADRIVLLVTHEVPIIISRYLIERLDEQQALEISRSGRLANCSLTSYRRTADRALQLDHDAWTAPLERSAAPVTEESDSPVGPR